MWNAVHADEEDTQARDSTVVMDDRAKWAGTGWDGVGTTMHWQGEAVSTFTWPEEQQKNINSTNPPR